MIALSEIVRWGDKGLPIRLTEEQEWAVQRIREFNYRLLFGLSKEEFLVESYDDVVINEEINRLYEEKFKRETKKLNKSK